MRSAKSDYFIECAQIMNVIDKIACGTYGRTVQSTLSVCITDSPLCRACMETEETPIHVMLQCNGVAEQRAAHLGSSATLHEALGDLGGLLSFWSELGWLE
ncbi:jg21168 [Pararge aegeria aegeria]|uniref:Jg21168 protein n=1 Tax=Pararge aegeria aegeria TaxID=348720 RepID=A0A8S4SIM4_9NEOP|nr:jg21168 [Pararge aegeria aegeria]